MTRLTSSGGLVIESFQMSETCMNCIYIYINQYKSVQFLVVKIHTSHLDNNFNNKQYLTLMSCITKKKQTSKNASPIGDAAAGAFISFSWSSDDWTFSRFSRCWNSPQSWCRCCCHFRRQRTSNERKVEIWSADWIIAKRTANGKQPRYFSIFFSFNLIDLTSAVT